MTSILFVDDEPILLSGLERTLRDRRGVWEMEFVNSGSEALQRLASKRFDVLVTDMRMPGMDGWQLLCKVRQQYPEMVRIVLSGQSDIGGIIRSDGTAHQYLSKPCGAALLKSTVTRACALKHRLNDPSLKRLVANISKLPSTSAVCTELMNELQSPDVCIARVGAIIATDPAMTAKVLQLANSSFFGLNHRINDPSQAAVYLGLDILKPLVLAAGVFAQCGAHVAAGFSLDDLVHHSMQVASSAKKLAMYHECGIHKANDAFVAGMLHDIGKLVLAAASSDRYKSVQRLIHEENERGWIAEERIYGASHADVGGYLLGLWGIPQNVVETVVFHHEPSKCADSQFGTLTAVHLANALADISPDVHSAEQCAKVDRGYIESLKLCNRLELYREIVHSSLDSPQQLLSAGITQTGTARANR